MIDGMLENLYNDSIIPGEDNWINFSYLGYCGTFEFEYRYIKMSPHKCYFVERSRNKVIGYGWIV